MQIRAANPNNPLTIKATKRLNHPLIPHLPIVRLPPDANLQRRVWRDVQRCLPVIHQLAVSAFYDTAAV